MALQIRRGTEAERTAGGGVVFAEGELIYVTDTDSLYVGDGSTAGGVLLTGSALATIGDYIVADTINSTLDLQQNLDLNGNDVIGTGNINITGNINATGNIVAGGNIDIGDADTDTLTISAKVDSGITPETDTAYDLGTASLRWRNIYANSAKIDGQIDAVIVSADVRATDSTLLVDAANGVITGNVTGNLIGDNISIGRIGVGETDFYGDVEFNSGTTSFQSGNSIDINCTVDFTGATITGFSGDVKGSVFGDDSTLIVDAVNNTVVASITGDVTGNVTGDVKGSISNDPVIQTLQGPADAIINAFDITATGTISGNLTGDVTGNVTGNTTGYHTGDVKGSVFADGSTLLVDAVAGSIPGENITGTVTASFAGNLTGDVTGTTTGTHIGNIETSIIDSSDSTAITVTPIMEFNSDVIINNSLYMNPTGQPGGDVIQIDSKGTVSCVLLETQRIVHSDGGELIFGNRVGFDKTTTFVEQATFIDKLSVQTITGEVEGKFAVETFTGDPDDDDSVANPANYNKHFEATIEKATFGVPAKFANMDTTTRNALTAEAGMVVFNTTDTKLQVYTGSAWVDLH